MVLKIVFHVKHLLNEELGIEGPAVGIVSAECEMQSVGTAKVLVASRQSFA